MSKAEVDAIYEALDEADSLDRLAHDERGTGRFVPSLVLCTGRAALNLLAPRNLDEAAPRADGTVRKAHYGSGVQPWDTMVLLGIAPGFAAGCVIRYLRRDKEPEHSLSSARWYYARLVEMAAESPVLALTKDARMCLGLLLSVLTPDEAARARFE